MKTETIEYKEKSDEELIELLRDYEYEKDVVTEALARLLEQSKATKSKPHGGSLPKATSVASKVLITLEKHPESIYQADSLAEFLGENPVNVSEALSRLSREDKIEKVDRGRYRAKKVA